VWFSNEGQKEYIREHEKKQKEEKEER